MDWSDFSGKKVALLGAGRENLSLIPHLQKAGATLTLCDPSGDLPPLPDWVKTMTGSNHLADLGSYDFVFRTPGMPVAKLAAILASLEKPPIVTSAVDLLFALKGGQTVAVTGTKGKGTTATMVTEILKAAKRPVILAGNIGNSIFDSWREITDDTVIVMEVSSFQLEDIQHGPHIAVILPITAEHLQPLSERSPNFHKDLPTYIAAKEKVTATQTPDDFVVFSLDSQASAQIGQASSAKKVTVSAKSEADVTVRNGVVSTGKGELDLAAATSLRGGHLFHNAAVACAAVGLLGISIDQMTDGLKNFRPLPHRMEEVGTFNGVTYVDDSYATAPDATIAALSAYPDQPIILLLGGSSKGMDFNELAEAIGTSRVKAAILIGAEAPKIEAALVKHAPAVARVAGLKIFRDAVESAVARAEPGDVVLLSPACASKDMFKDAAERGEKFVEIIHELV